MAKIIVHTGRTSRSYWAESEWWSFGRTIQGQAIWQVFVTVWLGEVLQSGMFIRTSWKKDCFYLCMWVTEQLAGKKQDIDFLWIILNKEVDFGTPTSFLDHIHLWWTQRQCDISKDKCGQWKSHVWITNFSGWTEKLPNSENLRISTFSYDFHGHAKKCVERHCEFANKTTKCLLRASMTIHFKEEKGNLLDSCHKYAFKLFEMLILCTNWKNQTFYGQWTNLHD